MFSPHENDDFQCGKCHGEWRELAYDDKGRMSRVCVDKEGNDKWERTHQCFKKPIDSPDTGLPQATLAQSQAGVHVNQYCEPCPCKTFKNGVCEEPGWDPVKESFCGKNDDKPAEVDDDGTKVTLKWATGLRSNHQNLWRFEPSAWDPDGRARIKNRTDLEDPKLVDAMMRADAWNGCPTYGNKDKNCKEDKDERVAVNRRPNMNM